MNVVAAGGLADVQTPGTAAAAQLLASCRRWAKAPGGLPPITFWLRVLDSAITCAAGN